MTGNSGPPYGVIVSIFFITSCFVAGVIIAGSVDDKSTPLISTVLGFGSIIIVQLLNGSRMERRVGDVDEKVDRVLNGTMDDKIRRVVTEVMDARGIGNDSVTGRRKYPPER